MGIEEHQGGCVEEREWDQEHKPSGSELVLMIGLRAASGPNTRLNISGEDCEALYNHIQRLERRATRASNQRRQLRSLQRAYLRVLMELRWMRGEVRSQAPDTWHIIKKRASQTLWRFFRHEQYADGKSLVVDVSGMEAEQLERLLAEFQGNIVGARTPIKLDAADVE